MPAPDDTIPYHASAVAFDGRGVLILGASGSGKSTLALELMSLGAELIADDRTRVYRQGAQLFAACPDEIRNKIEVRHMGILGARSCGPTPLALVVDLDHQEMQRLPPFRNWERAGLSVPLVHKAAQGAFPVAIRQYLLYGRSE